MIKIIPTLTEIPPTFKDEQVYRVLIEFARKILLKLFLTKCIEMKYLKKN